MSKEENYRRYLELGHAIQSGIAFLMNKRATLTDPKHLRVGLNLRAVDHGALVALLIEKGIFTEEEYSAKLVEWAEREVTSYEQDAAAEHYGAKVTFR